MSGSKEHLSSVDNNAKITSLFVKRMPGRSKASGSHEQRVAGESAKDGHNGGGFKRDGNGVQDLVALQQKQHGPLLHLSSSFVASNDVTQELSAASPYNPSLHGRNDSANTTQISWRLERLARNIDERKRQELQLRTKLKVTKSAGPKPRPISEVAE